MDIDRHEYQPYGSAKERVKFCLDRLEKAKDFSEGISWETNVVHRLTVEEIIGALVSVGQEFTES